MTNSVVFTYVSFVRIKKQQQKTPYFEQCTDSLRDAKFVGAITLRSQIIVHNTEQGWR